MTLNCWLVLLLAVAVPSTHVHWSRPQRVCSPDSSRCLIVGPHDENDNAPVYVEDAASGRRLLFVLTRDGQVTWGPDGASLLVEDQRFANDFRLLLFSSVDGAVTETQASALDKEIRSRVYARVAPTDELIRYEPKLVSWRNDSLVVAVQYETAPANGPATGYCVGFKLDVKTSSISAVLTDAELERQYGLICDLLRD